MKLILLLPFTLAASAFAETAEIGKPTRDSVVLYTLPAGASVEKGSVIAVVDPAPLIAEIKRQEAALTDLRAALEQKKQGIPLIDPAAAADLSAKKDALTKAESDLQEYTQGDGFIEEQTLTQTLNDATNALAQEQTRFEARDKMLAEGFIQKSEWEQQGEKVKSCKLALAIAQARLDKFTKFARPRRLRELQSAIATLKAAIAQIPVNASKAKADLASGIDSVTKQIAAADKLLAATRETLKTATILTAPISGRFIPGPSALIGTVSSQN